MRCDDCVDIDDDAVDTDERECVDGEEQHDDDDDTGASGEQPGPPVGLYLKDNIIYLSISVLPLPVVR